MSNNTGNKTASVWDMPIPEGHFRDARGKIVHMSLITDADATRDATVVSTVLRAIDMAATVNAFFADILGELEAFCELSAERFGTSFGKTESYAMTSYDGRFKVAVACDATLTVNETINTAKKLLDECIADWTNGGKPQAVALVQDTFRQGKFGRISIARLLTLLRHKNAEAFKGDERFQQVCKAIESSLQETGKKRYIRFHHRATPADKWVMVEFGTL